MISKDVVYECETELVFPVTDVIDSIGKVNFSRVTKLFGILCQLS